MPAELIRLTTKAKTKEGKPTGTIYTTKRNKRNGKDKIKIKKFDRRAYNEKTGREGAHVLFEEEKMK